jgi:hypothetical protein
VTIPPVVEEKIALLKIYRHIVEENSMYSLGHMSPDAGILRARVNIFSTEKCYFHKTFPPNELGQTKLFMFSFSEILRMADTSEI